MPEFPTLRHTISDIRMRYAPDRATAKGACSDFCYLYRSNLQHRHDPADRIHTTPPHPRVSPRHGRNRGQPAAAARRRAGASLHQTHLRRSFDQRKRQKESYVFEKEIENIMAWKSQLNTLLDTENP